MFNITKKNAAMLAGCNVILDLSCRLLAETALLTLLWAVNI